MCLSTVISNNPVQKSGIAYKLFRGRFGKIYPFFYGLDGKSSSANIQSKDELKIGKKYINKVTNSVEYVAAGEELGASFDRYELGFHMFATEEAARKWSFKSTWETDNCDGHSIVLTEVAYDKACATGTQLEFLAIVAHEMTITKIIGDI